MSDLRVQDPLEWMEQNSKLSGGRARARASTPYIGMTNGVPLLRDTATAINKSDRQLREWAGWVNSIMQPHLNWVLSRNYQTPYPLCCISLTDAHRDILTCLTMILHATRIGQGWLAELQKKCVLLLEIHCSSYPCVYYTHPPTGSD